MDFLKAAAAKAQAGVMAQVPALLETAEPQIEKALVESVSKMPPSRVAMISTNLRKLSAAVDKAAVMQVAPAIAGKRKKTSKRTRRNRKK